MIKPFEREALKTAIVAVKAAMEAVSKAQVSVHCDYVASVANNYLDNALVELESALIE